MSPVRGREVRCETERPCSKAIQAAESSPRHATAVLDLAKRDFAHRDRVPESCMERLWRSRTRGLHASFAEGGL